MIKRFIFALCIIIILTLIISTFKITFLPSFYATIFTVIGIFYSIGYSISLGFHYNKIENEEYALRIRKEVKKVIHSFTFNLFMAALLFIVNSILPDYRFAAGLFSFYPNVFCGLALMYILFYLVYNFLRLERFKEQLDDKIRKDNE
jgi:hypothetical protein